VLLLVKGPEALFGPVQKYPQVVPVNAELLAHLVFVLFLDKERIQNTAIFLWELFQDLSHLLLGLLGDQHLIQVDSFVRRIHRIIFQVQVSRRGAIVFQQHVIANRVHKRAQTGRIADSSFVAQAGQHTGECLLANVFNGLRRAQPAAQLDQQKLVEIRDKMIARGGVASAEALEISLVKGLQFQALSTFKAPLHAVAVAGKIRLATSDEPAVSASGYERTKKCAGRQEADFRETFALDFWPLQD